MATADGLIGYSLDPKLVGKVFWTLSAWRDHDALHSFAGADPHRGRTTAIRPHMNPTTFVTWTVSEIPVKWETARQQINRKAGDR